MGHHLCPHLATSAFPQASSSTTPLSPTLLLKLPYQPAPASNWLHQPQIPQTADFFVKMIQFCTHLSFSASLSFTTNKKQLLEISFTSKLDKQ